MGNMREHKETWWQKEGDNSLDWKKGGGGRVKEQEDEQNGIKLQGRVKKHQNVRCEVLAVVVLKIQGFSTRMSHSCCVLQLCHKVQHNRDTRMCHSCCVLQLCHKLQHNKDTTDVTIQCSHAAACNEAELYQSCWSVSLTLGIDVVARCLVRRLVTQSAILVIQVVLPAVPLG